MRRCQLQNLCWKQQPRRPHVQIKNTFFSLFFFSTGDIYHVFIISPCHVANSGPLFFPRCLLHSLSHPLRRLQVNMFDRAVVFMALYSVCGLCLAVSGEMAWCWTLPCCLGWAISGWWRLSRWRRNVGSRTSTAASPCPPGVPPSPTLENSLSEVNYISVHVVNIYSSE